MAVAIVVVGTTLRYTVNYVEGKQRRNYGESKVALFNS